MPDNADMRYGIMHTVYNVPFFLLPQKTGNEINVFMCIHIYTLP